MTMSVKSIDQFITYVKASFPIIHFLSDEYERVEEEVGRAVEIINTKILPNSKTDPWLKDIGISIGKWNCVDGLSTGMDSDSIISGTIDLEDALKYILKEISTPSIILLENIHPFLNSPMAPVLVQLLIEIYRERYRHKHVVITSTEPLPQALHTYVVTIDFALPTKDEIKDIVQNFIDTNLDDIKKINTGSIANICVGMNALEIESALCVSAVSSKEGLDKTILYNEKAKAVRKSGLLELIEISDTMKDVGGLTNLKQWFKLVAKAFKNPDKSEKYRLPNMKGVLITGISGTGKSLCAKAIADLFEVPLIRFDIGKVYGSLVGETERNTREAFKLIDAVSPCVVLIDEIEKALAGIESSGSTDSGVTARFIGSFLYYMQEKRSQSFFVCTANDISKLPPEIVRKGRFDEIWYVGLPSKEDIEKILAIHLKKAGRKPSKFNLSRIASYMDKFTGAEVENCVKEALYRAFFDSREISDEDIIKAAKETVPLVKTRKNEIQALEKWAREGAKFANKSTQKSSGRRKDKARLDLCREKD